MNMQITHEEDNNLVSSILELINTGVLSKKDIIKLKRDVDVRKKEYENLIELSIMLDRLGSDI